MKLKQRNASRGIIVLLTTLFAFLLFYVEPAQAIQPMLGTKRILVMTVDFPDIPNSAPALTSVSNAMVSANSFFRSNSFNQLSLITTVIGPLRMPSNSSNYVAGFNISGLRSDALAAARNSGYDATNFDYDILTFTNINLPFYGWATISSRGLWVQNFPGFPFGSEVTNHELGHNWGLGHAHAWISKTVIGDGTSSEGGNLFDVMGNPRPNSHYNSNFKALLGWIPPHCIHTATSNGIYRIYAEDSGGNLDVTRKYSLVVPAGITTPGNAVDYWVECRGLMDNIWLQNGVAVMWADNASVGQCYLLDTTPGSLAGAGDVSDCPVTLGRSFTDPNKKITIAPIAKGGTGADTYFDVQVTLNSLAIPPAIVQQPANQSVVAGANAIMSVTANSSVPIYYQWRRYGTVVAGATNAILSLTNASVAQAGDYMVVLSNSLGSVASSAATLTVNYPPPSECYPAPNGLVAWWTGDDHPLDWKGTNHGVLPQTASYAPGIVGQAFSLNGTSDFVQIPNSPLWAFGTNDFTIELWARFSVVGNDTVFVADDNGGGQIDKWIFWWCDKQLRFYVVNGNGPIDMIGNAYFWPTTNQWYHLAVTRLGSAFTFYINGAPVSTNISTISVPAVTAPLTIGVSAGVLFFGGQLDELRIYNRGLAGSAIFDIYRSGTIGLCWPTNPPAYVEFSTAETMLQGGTTNASLLLRRSGNTASGISVGCLTADGSAVAGTDYVPRTGTVTLAANETATPINVGILGDGQFFGTKQFSLQLSAQSSNVILGANAKNIISIVGGGCLPAPAGLLGWWSGNNNANDLASTNHGVLLNGVTYTPGVVGSAFRFDGVDDYVEIPNSAACSFAPASSMSICLWAYRTSASTAMHLLGKRAGCASTGMNYQLAYGTGFGGLFFNGDNGGVYPSRDMPMNTWMHLAVTFDGGTFCFYIDGILAGTGGGTLGPSNSAPLRLGKAGECGGITYFGGVLDEVVFFNRTLSPAEVQNIYQSGNKGICALPPTAFQSVKRLPDGQYQMVISGYQGSVCKLQFSTNLFDWLVLSDITLPGTPLVLTNNPPYSKSGFYRTLKVGDHHR